MLVKDNVTKEEKPKLFDEPLNHPNKESHRKWCESIHKAIGDMKGSYAPKFCKM